MRKRVERVYRTRLATLPGAMSLATPVPSRTSFDGVDVARLHARVLIIVAVKTMLWVMRRGHLCASSHSRPAHYSGWFASKRIANTRRSVMNWCWETVITQHPQWFVKSSERRFVVNILPDAWRTWLMFIAFLDFQHKKANGT